MNSEMGCQLSIITVCFNAKEELKQTIESVLKHKRLYSLSIEHVIVDGASTDGTPELLKEYHAAGYVEVFVSEPDAGIYDGMNKGIRMATGKVLYFLNAGDVLTCESLEKWVAPIAQGRYMTAAAAVLRVSGDSQVLEVPAFEYVYLGTPVCHQGYFAAASLYRELGGYDSATYRCLADADFINRAFAATGVPYENPLPVSVYADGGFSADCGYRFLPEYFEMRNRHWELVLKRCREDAHYEELISFALLEHCSYLVSWVAEFGLEKSNIELHLRHLTTLRRVTRSVKQKILLLWAEKVCVYQLMTLRKTTMLVTKLTKWVTIAGSLRPDNPYMKMKHYPHRSLRKALYALLRGWFVH